MSAWRAVCPAKINLALHVAGRREDGYHEIVTLFQAIDLRDELTGADAESLTLTVSDPSIPSDESNLVLRAARLLAVSVPGARDRGARLHLLKRIPAGGGLGGGSADAAGALLLLNALWGLELDREALVRLGQALGSDVPFFLFGGTALGTGRGEVIRPLRPIEERPLVLGVPPFPLSTPEVYRALHAPLTGSGPDVTVPRLFLKLAEGNDFALARNDLEAAAMGMRHELRAFRDALARSGAELALMSGSGSAVFGMYRAGTDVSTIAESLRGACPGFTVRVSKTIPSGIEIDPAATA